MNRVIFLRHNNWRQTKHQRWEAIVYREQSRKVLLSSGLASPLIRRKVEWVAERVRGPSLNSCLLFVNAFIFLENIMIQDVKRSFKAYLRPIVILNELASPLGPRHLWTLSAQKELNIETGRKEGPSTLLLLAIISCVCPSKRDFTLSLSWFLILNKYSKRAVLLLGNIKSYLPGFQLEGI